MSAPTGFTLITAAKIQDSSGRLLTAGRVNFFPVTSSGGPVSAIAGGGGGLLTQSDVTFLVVNGAITTDLYGNAAQIADTTLTTPPNIAYSVNVIDATGTAVQGPGYGLVQPSGSSWSLDSYIPVQPSNITVQPGPTGLTGANGTINNTYQGAYVNGAGYAAGALVSWTGSTYLAIALVLAGTSAFPDVSPAYWARLAAGIFYYGVYNPTKVYAKNSVTLFAGSSYIYLVEADGTSGHEPDTSPIYWGILSQVGPAGPVGPSPGSAAAIYLTDTVTGVINIVTILSGQLNNQPLSGGLPTGASTSSSIPLLDSVTGASRTISIQSGQITVS